MKPRVKPIRIKGRRVVLTEKMIQDSHEVTKSNAAAAKWLGVSYNTYKKWAQYYGLFDGHLNQEGYGIKKGWSSYQVDLEEIITGNRKLPGKYSHSVLKNRLIDEGYFQEECHKCGYNEQNLKTGKVCLKLNFKDGDSKNLKIENLQFLCPNCYLSLNGFFHKSKYFCK